MSDTEKPPLLIGLLQGARKEAVHPLCRLPRGFVLMEPGEVITNRCRYTNRNSPAWVDCWIGNENPPKYGHDTHRVHVRPQTPEDSEDLVDAISAPPDDEDPPLPTAVRLMVLAPNPSGGMTPLVWDPGCKGAVQFDPGSSEPVALFKTRQDADRAVRISIKWNELLLEQYGVCCGVISNRSKDFQFVTAMTMP